MTFLVQACSDKVCVIDITVPKLAYFDDRSIRTKLLCNSCIVVQVIISRQIEICINYISDSLFSQKCNLAGLWLIERRTFHNIIL